MDGLASARVRPEAREMKFPLKVENGTEGSRTCIRERRVSARGGEGLQETEMTEGGSGRRKAKTWN